MPVAAAQGAYIRASYRGGTAPRGEERDKEEDARLSFEKEAGVVRASEPSNSEDEMSAPPALPDAATCAQLDAQIERLLRCSPLPEPEVKVRC